MAYSGQRHVRKPEVLSIYFGYCIWGQLFIHPKLFGICSILWYPQFILLQQDRTLQGISSSLNIKWGNFINWNVCSVQYVVKEKIKTGSLEFHLTPKKCGSAQNPIYDINSFTVHTLPSPNMPNPPSWIESNMKQGIFLVLWTNKSNNFNELKRK